MYEPTMEENLLEAINAIHDKLIGTNNTLDKIATNTSYGRACKVNGGQDVFYFHQIVTASNGSMMALIENSHGRLFIVGHHCIEFTEPFSGAGLGGSDR